MPYLPYFEYLALPGLAFSLWMLYDAYHRRAEPFWYWVILLAQPLGAIAYFCTHKLPELGGASWWPLGPRRPSLEELRYRAEQLPTLATRLELAEGLIEHGHHAEAIAPLEAALKAEPDHCRVLFLLALCHTEQGHPERALPLLDRVMARDRAWSDYRAWRLLVAARAQHGDSLGALAACRDLVRLSPTLEHQCLLVERLLADGLTDEAHTVLETSLEEHRYAPAPVRRRNRRWASHARHLRKRIRVASQMH